MTQFAAVEVEPLRVGAALGGLAVDDKHARDLGQLGKDDFVLILYPTHNAMLQQVPIAFIVLVLCEL